MVVLIWLWAHFSLGTVLWVRHRQPMSVGKETTPTVICGLFSLVPLNKIQGHTPLRAWNKVRQTATLVSGFRIDCWKKHWAVLSVQEIQTSFLELVQEGGWDRALLEEMGAKKEFIILRRYKREKWSVQRLQEAVGRGGERTDCRNFCLPKTTAEGWGMCGEQGQSEKYTGRDQSKGDQETQIRWRTSPRRRMDNSREKWWPWRRRKREEEDKIGKSETSQVVSNAA